MHASQQILAVHNGLMGDTAGQLVEHMHTLLQQSNGFTEQQAEDTGAELPQQPSLSTSACGARTGTKERMVA